MANQEHLEILKKGIEAWNKWRRQYPSKRPNLSEANLPGAHLTEPNLIGANLTEANARLICNTDG